MDGNKLNVKKSAKFIFIVLQLLHIISSFYFFVLVRAVNRNVIQNIQLQSWCLFIFSALDHQLLAVCVEEWSVQTVPVNIVQL